MVATITTTNERQMVRGAGREPSGKPEVLCCEDLRKTPLFSGLSDEQLRVIAPPCHRLSAYNGKVLFSKGEETKEIYILLDGEVCLEEELSPGQHLLPRTILVERVGRNGVFGLCALVKPGRAMLTARCTADANVVAVNAETLRALIRTHSAIGLLVLENAFKITYERLMLTQHRIITELGLPAMYEAHRNY